MTKKWDGKDRRCGNQLPPAPTEICPYGTDISKGVVANQLLLERIGTKQELLGEQLKEVKEAVNPLTALGVKVENADRRIGELEVRAKELNKWVMKIAIIAGLASFSSGGICFGIAKALAPVMK